MTALVSVIIPTYTRANLLFRGISSLLMQSVDDVEIIVVDNASPATIGLRVTKRFGHRVRVIRLRENLFYCGAVNRGYSISAGRYIAVINDDCWVEKDWAERAVATFEQFKNIGAVASLVLRDGSRDIVDSAGDHLDITGRATNLYWSQPVSQVPNKPTAVFSAAGSCAIYQRNAFSLAGGFDEDFTAYLDDVDLGFRLQLLGYPTLFNPECRAHHVGGGTKKSRSYAAFLTERNMVWNLIKNMPAPIIQRHHARILAAQLHPAPIYGGSSLCTWLKGKSAAILGLQKMLTKRKQIQRASRVSGSYVEALLLSRNVASCHL